VLGTPCLSIETTAYGIYTADMFNLFPVLLVVFTILAIASLVVTIATKQKLYLIGFALFSAGDVVVTVLYVIMPFIMFAANLFSLERFGFSMAGNQYHFTVHEYNYKTDDIGNRFYNHTDKLVMENLCEVSYGFYCDPHVKQAKDNDGNLIARSGLPFAFSIEFRELNHDIERIHFNSAEIILNDNNIINMFNLDYIDYGAWYIVSEEIDSKLAYLDNKELRLQFKNKQEINFSGLKQKAVEKAEQSNEEDKIKYLDESPMFCKAKFKPITFDVTQNEEIVVRIKIEIIMSDGRIENIVLDNIYKREYHSYDDAWPRPLEELDKEEGYKL
jgi:hypothetical protein